MPEIKYTANVLKDTGVKLVVYGDAGVGKTRLISTLPNPMTFSCEKGMLTLRKFNLPYIEVLTYSQMMDAMKWLLESNEAKKFDSFAMDSFTDMAEILLRHEMTLTNNGQKAYGEMGNKMIDLLRKIKNVPRHFYIICQLEQAKNELDQVVKMGPSAPGKMLINELRYQPDELFYFYAKENKETNETTRALLTRANENYHAKDRSEVLEQWEQADLGNIIRKISQV